MNHIQRTPTWLRIAAAMMAAEHLALFISPPVNALSGVSLVGALLVAWFLLRGSRVAWVLAIFWAASDLLAPFMTSEPVWLAGTAAIVLACLLTPPARGFVWASVEGGAS
jgi:hypothetical protein